MIQLELPNIPHAPAIGEPVNLVNEYAGNITYVYPAKKIWCRGEVVAYQFHVDVFHESCRRYSQVYMFDYDWTGTRWECRYE